MDNNNKESGLKQKYEVFDENNNVIVMNVELVLLHLIQQNDLENIKECEVLKRNLNYLEKFPDIDIDSSVSPLIAASYLGRVDIVKLLLQNPTIDIDYATEEIKHTPLTVACLSGNFEVLKILLDAGAEVNKPNFNSYTPFVFCFQRLEVESNIFENRKICLKMVDLLLQYGTDINWIVNKQKGYTLLMQLCALKIEMTQSEKEINYEIIKFLIENGANKSITTHKGKNAFDLAEKHCNKDAIRDILVNYQQKYFYNKFGQQSTTASSGGINSSGVVMGANDKPLKPIPKMQEKNHKRSKSLASYLVLCNK